MKKEVDAREVSGVKQNIATDLMLGINSERFGEQNMLGRNEFSLSYTAFEGLVLV